jgi:hypothetical protein
MRLAGADVLRVRRVQRGCDGSNESIGVEGLWDEPRRAGSQSTRLQSRIPTPGHDNDRQREANLVQPLLQLEARHAGHVHIGDHAALPFGSKRRKEVLGVFERDCRKPLQSEHERQRITHGRVVVDDENAIAKHRSGALGSGRLG